MISEPKIGCVLVNWNGWPETVNCVRALSNCAHKNMFVVVVDNGSTNDSVERLREMCPEIILIEAASNLGYAGGNNLGIRYSLEHSAEYVWLLNNDTEPDSNALPALVAKIRSDHRFGAVASVCYYFDRPSEVQVWAGAQVNLWIGRSRNSTVPRSDDWFDSLYGASLLTSSIALRDAGLLDEGFFLLWEETEFCLRLRKTGWRLGAAPDSKVLHKVHSSSGGKGPLVDRYFTASGLRILRLHSGAPRLAMCLFVIARLVRRLFRLQFANVGSVLLGVRDYRRRRPLIQRIA
jgi:GT2 family glycosyltransferase